MKSLRVLLQPGDWGTCPHFASPALPWVKMAFLHLGAPRHFPLGAAPTAAGPGPTHRTLQEGRGTEWVLAEGLSYSRGTFPTSEVTSLPPP